MNGFELFHLKEIRADEIHKVAGRKPAGLPVATDDVCDTRRWQWITTTSNPRPPLTNKQMFP